MIIGRKNWLYWVLIAIIFMAGIAIRLFDLTDPPLDFHPTRQLRAAIIARGMYFSMQPQADPDAQQAAIQSWKSLETYEPPIFEAITALTYRLAGGEKLWISRIFATFFWAIGGIFLLLLLRRWKYTDSTLISLGIYFFIPFVVQASRSFQPEPLMVMTMLLFLYCLDRYSEKSSWKWTIIVGIVGGLAVLVKAVAFFYVGGALILVLMGMQGTFRWMKDTRNWIVIGLVILPAVLYYLVGLGNRSAGFIAAWTVSFLPTLLSTNFYADWLHMIDSLFSLSIFFIALASTMLLAAQPKRIAIGLWLGYVVYGLTSPYQYVTHTYYHLPLIIVLALGITSLASSFFMTLRSTPLSARVSILVLLLAVSGYYLWISRSVLVVENFRNEPPVWEKIGQAVPRDGQVIALTQDYGNRLMYFGNIKPADYWPTTSGQNLAAAKGKNPKDFEATFVKLTDGKRYFLVTALGQLDDQPQLEKKLAEYKIISSGDGYHLYDLTLLSDGT